MLTLRALAALLVVAWAPQCGAASLVVGGSAPHAPTTPRTTPRLASPRAAELDVDALGLTPALTKTVKGFQMVPDQKLRYQQLLFLAKKLPPMQPELQVEDNKVPGCLSTVYVHAALEGNVISYAGESDSQLTKGLAALLIQGLSGSTNAEIQAVRPEFIQAAGLAQSLTPGRNNGFVNMLAKMKQQAAALSEDGSGETAAGEGMDGGGPPPPRAGDPTMCVAQGGEEAVPLGPTGSRMARSLREALQPTELSLIDDSASHAGHAGSRGFESGESHFNLRIRSESFSGLRGLKRHQLVYKALEEIMPEIHALSITALAPDEEAR